jgi:5-methylcytosine-specific restriction endonuclease McrA
MAYIESRSWYEWHWERGIDPDNKRDPLPPNLRAAVIDRDGYVCQICGGDIEPTDLHIDHIKPWSKGGRHTLGNLQATHSVCNLKKGDRVDGED